MSEANLYVLLGISIFVSVLSIAGWVSETIERRAEVAGLKREARDAQRELVKARRQLEILRETAEAWHRRLERTEQ
jgi:hypothetical protein